MSRNDDHREVSSGRASKETTRRFKGELRREVGDLEVRLEEAQLRSDAFLHAGLDREAAEVLEESRQMVDEFHQRLNSALAAAAVEREAEWILASSLDVVDVLGDEETSGGGLLARIPAGVGAAVASVAVLAMALVTLRTPQQRDVRPASDVALALPDDGEDTTAASSGVQRGPGLDDRLRYLSPAEMEVLAAVSEPEAVAPLLERRRRLLDQLQQAASGGSSDLDTVLAELDQLVEALVREGVDVDRLLELEREHEVERVEEPEEGQAQDPATETQGPPEQPQDEAAEDEAPADGSEEEDGGSVFPFEGDGEGEPDDESSGAGASGSDNDDKDDDGGLLGD